MQIDTEFEQRDKIVLALGILLVLFLCFLYYVKNRTPEILNYPNNNSEIIAFGDSLVSGVGSESNRGFVRELEVFTNTNIINMGISGDTTRDALARIDDVLKRNPKMVLISLGGNDSIQHVPAKAARKNLDKIVSQIQNTGSMVIILGVPAAPGVSGYKNLYKEVAEDHRAAYVPNILAGLIGRDEFMADLIHPNDLGYIKVAEKIAPIMKLYLE